MLLVHLRHRGRMVPFIDQQSPRSWRGLETCRRPWLSFRVWSSVRRELTALHAPVPWSRPSAAATAPLDIWFATISVDGAHLLRAQGGGSSLSCSWCCCTVSPISSEAVGACFYDAASRLCASGTKMRRIGATRAALVILAVVDSWASRVDKKIWVATVLQYVQSPLSFVHWIRQSQKIFSSWIQSGHSCLRRLRLENTRTTSAIPPPPSPPRFPPLLHSNPMRTKGKRMPRSNLPQPPALQVRVRQPMAARRTVNVRVIGSTTSEREGPYGCAPLLKRATKHFSTLPWGSGAWPVTPILPSGGFVKEAGGVWASSASHREDAMAALLML